MKGTGGFRRCALVSSRSTVHVVAAPATSVTPESRPRRPADSTTAAAAGLHLKRPPRAPSGPDVLGRRVRPKGHHLRAPHQKERAPSAARSSPKGKGAVSSALPIALYSSFGPYMSRWAAMIRGLLTGLGQVSRQLVCRHLVQPHQPISNLRA